jgi:hypothetical protein
VDYSHNLWADTLKGLIMGFIGNLFKLGPEVAPSRGAKALGAMARSAQGFTPSGGQIGSMGSRSSAVNSAVQMSGTYGKSARQAGKMVNPGTGLPMR